MNNRKSEDTNAEEEVVWIRSERGDNDDPKCLGPYGFTTCGEMSFWLLIAQPSTSLPFGHKQYQLQIAPDLSQSAVEDKRLCLLQKRYFSFNAAPFLGDCGSEDNLPSLASQWIFSPGGQIYYSYWGLNRCLVPGLEDEAATEKCLPDSAAFDIVTHMSSGKVRSCSR